MLATATPAEQASRFRDHYGVVDFDLGGFLASLHKPVSKVLVSRTFDISAQSILNWQAKKLFPLTFYKAVLATFGGMDLADKYESEIRVTQQPIGFWVSPAIHRASREYDRQRAGSTFAFADGNGTIKIPEAAANYADPDTPAAEASPVVAEEMLADEIPSDNVLLQEQNVLLEVLSRVTLERNRVTLENAQLLQRNADLNARIRQQAERIQLLERNVKEWEELAGKEVTAKASPFNGEQLVEDIVKRLGGALAKKGMPHLVEELEKLRPKQAGHLLS